MIIFKSINKLSKHVNFKANIGFVPTMGALHEGHISLIKASKKKCKKTIVSIFVNPSQFNRKTDFQKYPRKLKKDMLILKKLKIDYLLIPNSKEIFSRGTVRKIRIKKKAHILCAKYRPGHFEGVLGVINQFLINIRARYLFLGEKDYQQAILINNYLKKNFKTKVSICKTIRNKNRLAFSSRNFLLSSSELEKASIVPNILEKFKKKIKYNLKYLNELNKIKKLIIKKGINIEYLELRNKYNLSNNYNKKNLKIFVAFFINKVRLIDNF